MPEAKTKRLIDTARDILVGKVPDPKTQVEQITFAMIYKFMDDMDQLSVSLGGKASFFTNGYEHYAWSKLMDRKLGGADRMDLYVRALEGMSTNPHIPQLFRDIFKGAFMPYRDAETLNLFLKEMNGFTYAHSEDLGDAYEYLLSIFASQGKAGQFRTPRHIIDFIVDCVNPGKHDTVLDPACGTAGFLISAYKHIIDQNKETPLSGEEKGRLTANFVGYDISPDMVRLSRVNMYLHQFANPTIHEYDTLTYEDRWDETFDVILANPPFMTPKGGIRPHTRFAVQANRSEVLFVDYIAEHLNPSGRAGVIVPEGIIFQSANAYKALRKMLVDGNYLYAVVSLPAGIFQPYSGVKTSVLLLDKDLAKRTNKVLFVSVKADGYDLGAQRREIERNDLPEALRMVKAFQEDPTAEPVNPLIAQAVSKARLGADGYYNLSGERYKAIKVVNQKWPMVNLGDVCTIVSGQSPEGKYYNEIGQGTPFYQGKTEFTERFLGAPTKWTTQETKIAEPHDILMSVRAPVGPVNITNHRICIGRGLAAIRPNKDKALRDYVFYLLDHIKDEIHGSSGSTFASINHKDIENIEIPLPPLEEQQAIVDEIEGYQKIIDGARQVVENYKPVIKIDPSWPLVRLGEVVDEIKSGFAYGNSEIDGEGLPHLRPMNISSKGQLVWEGTKFVPLEEFSDKQSYSLHKGDVLFNNTNSKELVGKTCLVPEDISGGFSNHITRIRVIKELIDPSFLSVLLHNYWRNGVFLRLCNKWVGQAGINNSALSDIEIPLPNIDIQKELVAILDLERTLINANFELIAIYEKKIETRIIEVWGI